MSNLFIVFEGIDGSGTSTQAQLLKNYLDKKLKKTIITNEPTDGPIGHLIKEAFSGRVVLSENKEHFDRQMAYLFAADRYDHLYNDFDGIIKLLDSYNVISTRYFFSSLAYHCNTKDDFEYVSFLNKNFPYPHLVIYIDNPISLSLERIKDRPLIDLYENKEKLFKVKNNYDSIFAKYKGLILKVNGSNDQLKIHYEITNFIKKKLVKKTKKFNPAGNSRP